MVITTMPSVRSYAPRVWHAACQTPVSALCPAQVKPRGPIHASCELLDRIPRARENEKTDSIPILARYRGHGRIIRQHRPCETGNAPRWGALNWRADGRAAAIKAWMTPTVCRIRSRSYEPHSIGRTGSSALRGTMVEAAVARGAV